MALKAEQSGWRWNPVDLARGLVDFLSKYVDRIFMTRGFASVTRRIILFNLMGLILLVGGILSASRYQEWLIDARIKSVEAQGDIVAEFVAAAATGEKDRILFDPGQPADEDVAAVNSLSLEIDARPISAVVLRTVRKTGTRIRIYTADGTQVLDSDELLRPDGKPVAVDEPDAWKSLLMSISSWFVSDSVGPYVEAGVTNGMAYEEVNAALSGQAASAVRLTANKRHVIAVGVPVIREKRVLGVAFLTTKGGEIDELILKERLSILRVALICFFVIVGISLVLAASIATPLRSIANAAERIQRNLSLRNELPEFPQRVDEIGKLSKTLRAMHDALYKRIERSERFAADVAHELKNPLTSVRSAAETLPLVRTEKDRQSLIETIQSDVTRLTRLIDDISKATRVEAEMALAEAKPVDLADLLKAVADVANNKVSESGKSVVVDFGPGEADGRAFFVVGHDLRLGQVFHNLIDNALSFSPPTGKVTIRARRSDAAITVEVEDEGSGIPPNNLERIFERFYTDRPGVDNFGKNSGLGLSISKEIVLAHQGQIWAENRTLDGNVAGARFSVRLPALVANVGPRPRFRRA
ncbi:MAG: stimulus-sensing domain-containing protein [Hyphomicrobiaceae bacterium]